MDFLGGFALPCRVERLVVSPDYVRFFLVWKLFLFLPAWGGPDLAGILSGSPCFVLI